MTMCYVFDYTTFSIIREIPPTLQHQFVFVLLFYSVNSFDRRHKSLALLSNDPSHEGSDEEIIGGICYRVYEEMRFAEIAFCKFLCQHDSRKVTPLYI